MDLISIIVPVYNVEQYLDKCVESIVSQTYKNIEIILVDDGSPDSCPTMCDDWAKKDDRIQVIHKENGGLSDARNAGLKIAKGNYIAFVDSDDWIDQRYIQYLYKAIQQTNAEISACDICKVNNETETKSVIAESLEVQLYTSQEAIKDILNNRRFRAVVWNKLYKREILRGEQFEIGRFHEDEFFSYRLYDKAENLAFLELSLYNYRQRSGSIMTLVSIRHLDVLDAYLERIELLEKKYPDLVLKDKMNFCIACINLYSEFLTQNKAQKRVAKRKIQECRKQISFSKEEFFSYSWKEKLYTIISKNGLIELACWFRILRKNQSYE